MGQARGLFADLCDRLGVKGSSIGKLIEPSDRVVIGDHWLNSGFDCIVVKSKRATYAGSLVSEGC